MGIATLLVWKRPPLHALAVCLDARLPLHGGQELRVGRADGDGAGVEHAIGSGGRVGVSRGPLLPCYRPGGPPKFRVEIAEVWRQAQAMQPLSKIAPLE